MKKKKIRAIHHEIDSPSPAYKHFKRAMRPHLPSYANVNPLLNYQKGHRQQGHGVMDLIYLSMKYGSDGARIWGEHQAQDMFSDYLLRNHGSFVRNIVEDGLNEFSRLQNKGKRSKNYMF